jgi:hypothetical protein
MFFTRLRALRDVGVVLWFVPSVRCCSQLAGVCLRPPWAAAAPIGAAAHERCFVYYQMALTKCSFWGRHCGPQAVVMTWLACGICSRQAGPTAQRPVAELAC